MELFVGGNSATLQGRPVTLSGKRCSSAYYSPFRDCMQNLDPTNLELLLDSGAFQNIKEGTRLSFEQSLERQLNYEKKLQNYSQDWSSWQVSQLASYDLLIDEKWIDGKKVKQRWSELVAWRAVEETIGAAAYLANQRKQLSPRTLILGCQGVTATQYVVCVKEVLKVATYQDWIGLGGWCILGKQQFWFPTYAETLSKVIPKIAQSKIKHVHIFGVLWLPAVGMLQAMCDRFGLSCSTDSQKPLSDCRWTTPEQRKRAGARCDNWEDNVNWWKNTLSNLHKTKYYQLPQVQQSLFAS